MPGSADLLRGRMVEFWAASGNITCCVTAVSGTAVLLHRPFFFFFFGNNRPTFAGVGDDRAPKILQKREYGEYSKPVSLKAVTHLWTLVASRANVRITPGPAVTGGWLQNPPKSVIRWGHGG